MGYLQGRGVIVSGALQLRAGLEEIAGSHQQPVLPAGRYNESSVGEGMVPVAHHSTTCTQGHKTGNFTKPKTLRKGVPQEILIDLITKGREE